MLEDGEKLVGRYLVVKQLGKGGMGAVYLALDELKKRRVAIKQFALGDLPSEAELQARGETRPRGSKPAPLTREKALEQFKQEAGLLVNMQHPNLPEVYDFFILGDEGFIVMTLVDGHSLADELVSQGGPLPEERVRDWIGQVLDALIYCHQQGVIHRDLKPDNLLLTAENRIVLVDFGIAKSFSAVSNQTITGARAFTPGFAPPEQCAPMGGTDQRTDIYSLGAVTYALLTNQTPIESIERSAEDSLPRPRALNPQISEGLETFILACMQLKKADRPQTAMAARDLLEGKDQTQPVPAHSPAAEPSPQEPEAAPATPRRNWRRWGAYGLGGLLLALLAWVVLSNSLPPRQAELATETPALSPAASLTPAASATARPATPLPPTPLPSETPTPTVALPVGLGTPYPPGGPVLTTGNAEGLVELARFGKGSLNQAIWAPDGEEIAVASSLGIYIYDAETLQEVRFIETGYWINCIAYAPNGKTLVSGGRNGQVDLWDAQSGQLLRSMQELHSSAVMSVAYSPTNPLVASVDWAGELRFWQVSDGRLLNQVSEANDGRQIVFSPDGTSLIVFARNSNFVKVYDVADGHYKGVIIYLTSYVNSVALSPDKRTIGIAGHDFSLVPAGWIQQENMKFETRLNNRLPEADRSNVLLAYAPDGTRLAAISASGGLYFFDTTSYTINGQIKAPAGNYLNLEFSPDSQYVLTFAQDDTLRIWQVADGTEVGSLEGHTSISSNVALSTDGTLAYGLENGLIELRQASDGSLVRQLGEGIVSRVTELAFSPDGSQLAAGYEDRFVIVWGLADGSQLKLEGHSARITALAFSPDGVYLASGSADRTARLWLAQSGKWIERSLQHDGALTDLAFSQDGNYLASSAEDKKFRLWRLATLSTVFTSGDLNSGLSSVATSSAANLYASGLADGNILLWEGENASSSGSLTGSTWPVGTLAFSPDGKLIASGSGKQETNPADVRLILWDVAEQRPVYSVPGLPGGGIRSLQFSADGRYLVSGGWDNTVRVWGVTGGQ